MTVKLNVNEDLLKRLEAAPIVPLVVPDDPETAIKTTQALVAGGLSVIEVVFRTSAAVECLGEVVRAVPEAIVGAGTVLSERQAAEVVFAGAQFIVSPGLYAPVVEYAKSARLTMSKFVTFGEIMLRLKTPSYEDTFGGGEANVAVALANYGLDTVFVSALL